MQSRTSRSAVQDQAMCEALLAGETVDQVATRFACSTSVVRAAAHAHGLRYVSTQRGPRLGTRAGYWTQEAQQPAARQ